MVTRTSYVRSLMLVLPCLLMLDALSTWIFLHNQTGVEGNPVVAGTMSAIGVVPALLAWGVVRIGAVIGISWISKQQNRLGHNAAALILTCLLVVYVWVVWHNFTEGVI